MHDLMERARGRPVEIACLVLVTLQFVGIALSRTLYPFDIGHYEAQMWAPANLLMTGRNPYNLAYALNPPYVVAPYGPFYYLLIGVGTSLFGLHLWFGRMVSNASMLISVLCLGRLSYLITRSLRLALFTILVFMSSFSVQIWASMQRADFPALALSLLGLTVAFESLERFGAMRKVRELLLLVPLAAGLFAAAIFSRQSYLLPALLAFVWYRRKSNRVVAWTFAGCFVLFLAPAFYYLNATSDGGFIQQAIVLQGMQEKNLKPLWGHFAVSHFSPSTWILDGLLAIATFKSVRFFITRSSVASERNKGQELLDRTSDHKTFNDALWLLLFTAVSLSLAATSASIGGNVNYYLEPFAMSSLCVVFAWAPSGLSIKAHSDQKYCFVIVLIALATLLTSLRIARGEYFRWQALPYYHELVRKLGEYVPENEPCLSEYPELATAAGRQYYFNYQYPYIGFPSKELRMIYGRELASGRLAAIVYGSPKSPPGYYRVDMSHPIPTKFYAVYLHVRSPQ